MKAFFSFSREEYFCSSTGRMDIEEENMHNN
jgi:hypothetical protein